MKMNWYDGSISDAIKTAKTQQAIFVVYVEGKDEQSQLMSEVLNSGEICSELSSNRFVAIKLSSDDVGYRQFVEIYKLVPVPSLFFIGNTGTPIDIVAADASRVNLETKIKEAITKCDVKVAVNSERTSSSPSLTTDDKGPSTSQVGKQSVISTEVGNSESDTSLQAEEEGIPKPSLEEKVDKAKKILEKKKQEKEVKEIAEEKHKEFERRRVGQEMQKAKVKQQDRELKEMIEEREREKREKAAAKQKILEQIAQDRAERAEREQMMKSGNVSQNQSNRSDPVENQPINVNSTRIQFKLPTGEARTHSFPPDTTLLQVREFINNNIELSFRDYKLATAFPRREFTGEDDGNTLSSLNLIPTGVILILPVAASNMRPYTRNWLKIASDLFWDMVKPVFSLANYIQQYFSPRPSNSPPSEPPAPPPQQQQSSQPSRSFVKKSGNIHSLRDIRDENDENNTWNGNSTQQM